MRTTIKTALSSVGPPVFWLVWTGQGAPPAQYTVFYYREKDAGFAGNQPTRTDITAYVSFNSSTDDDAKCIAIKTAMRSIGFVLLDDSPSYDPTSATFQSITVWNYVGVD